MDPSSSAPSSSDRVYRKDYKPCPFVVEQVYLNFILGHDETLVENRMTVRCRDPSVEALVLDGDFCELTHLSVNGKKLTEGDYTVGVKRCPNAIVISKEHLDLDKSNEVFVKNKTFPSKNSLLQGLYKSNDILCTHCEPEGFRRITYYIDQPDNMAIFRVRLEGPKDSFPVLLSNGDEVEREDFGDRHAACFVDPFPKPAHLFALVAGPLYHIHSKFTTRSGNPVDVYVYAEDCWKDQLDYAMKVLLASFEWDEEKFGREYDLASFRAVGISDFNMGAMENKSLNIFNIQGLAASDKSTNDFFYQRVASCVCHEYFHNWSGDRVSVRDWFQIQLKEGFTSFREQRFMEDWFDKGVQRINVVNRLRTLQFPEDSSATSHSIRPDSYINIDNFYTPTIYFKGCEVIRLYQVLLGEEGFRKGCDLYFSRYDGQAVSCDEFRAAMAEANDRDLSQFELWYQQRRTPTVSVELCEGDAATHTLKLKLKQQLPEDANYGAPVQPLHIPICVGFVGKESRQDIRTDVVLELTQWEQDFTVSDISEACVPSVMRGFSAPVNLQPFLSEEDQAFLMNHDSDSFNRWEATQVLMSDLIIKRAKAIMATSGEATKQELPPVPDYIMSAVESVVGGAKLSQGMAALMLTLPNAIVISTRERGLHPYWVNESSHTVYAELAKKFKDQIIKRVREAIAEGSEEGVDVSGAAMGRRAFVKSLCRILSHESDSLQILVDHYGKAKAYESRESMASLLVSNEDDAAAKCVADLREYCSTHGEIAMDSWFKVIGGCQRKDALQYITHVADSDPAYKDSRNVNRLRTIVETMCLNPAAFNHPSGEGYKWVAKQLIYWDTFNSSVAAVAAKKLAAYALYDAETQTQMKDACRLILESGHCSAQLQEIVGPASH